MELDDVQRDLQALAHDFAEREMRPLAHSYDESEEFPWPVVRKAAEVGLTCYDLPEEYGGGGIDSLVTMVAIIEELAWGCSAMAGCIGGGSFFAGPIVALGTPEQKERWLPPLCSPTDPVIGALATTEPNAGSDAAAMTTSAAKVDGGYVLNGQKTWISCAPTADQYVVFAQTVPGSRSRGITAFLLLRGRRGLHDRQEDPEDGRPLLPGRRAVLRGLLRGRRPPGRRRGRGLLRADAVVRRVARRTRRERRRHRPRGARVRGRVRQGARAVRQEDPRVPGRLVPPRGRQDEARPGAAADVPRGGAGRCGQAVRDRGCTGQAGRRRRPRGSPRGRRR